MVNTHCEKRPGEGIHTRFERGIIEPLVAKYDRLAGWPCRPELIDRIAQGSADRAWARVVLHLGFTHNEVSAFRGTQRYLRRSAGSLARRRRVPVRTPHASTHDRQSLR